ncbi:hypothetical protein [Sphingobacterium sp. UBA6320]
MTNTIEGREVKRYFDPISGTAVIGANALSAIRAIENWTVITV